MTDIKYKQNLKDRFIYPQTRTGTVIRNIAVSIAGAALAVGAFFTLRPNPKDDLAYQLRQNIDGFDSFASEPNFDVSDRDIFTFKPVKVKLANGSQCTATFRVRLKPTLEYTNEFNNAGDCIEGKASDLPQDVIVGNICNANFDTEQLEDDLDRNIPGFRKIVRSVDPTTSDCETTSAAVRPVFIETDRDDSCEIWALVGPKNGLTLFDPLSC